MAFCIVHYYKLSCLFIAFDCNGNYVLGPIVISTYIQRVRLRLAYIGGLLPHWGWLDIQISLYESCQSHNGNDNGRSTTFSTLAADTMMLLPHCTVRPASCNTNPQLTNTAFLSLSTQIEIFFTLRTHGK